MVLLVIVLFSAQPDLFAQVDGKVLRNELKVSFDGNRIIKTRSYEIQINRPEGDWLGEIQIPYQEDNGVQVVEAVILNQEGEVLRKLRKKEFMDRSDLSASAFHWDTRVIAFHMKWDEYPYRVRYTYTRSYKQFTDLVNWDPYPFFKIGVAHAELELELPLSMKYRVYADSLFEHSTREEDGVRKERFSISDLRPVRQESMAPPWQEWVPRIRVLPETFFYGVPGSNRDWRSFGNWFLDLNGGLLDLPAWEVQGVHELIDGLETDQEKVEELYRYLQDRTRYVNVSLDDGGLRSYPASYVSQNAYGDCKALSTYMMALLAEAGIASHYCLVRAGENTKRIDPDYPGTQFNHVVIAVPLDGDTIWLETTSKDLPFNYLGTFTQGRKALFISRDSSRLVDTPEMMPGDVMSHYVLWTRISGADYNDLTIFIQGRGRLFEKISYYDHAAQESSKEEFFRSLSRFDDFEMDSYLLGPDHRSDGHVLVHLRGRTRSMTRKVGDRLLLLPRLHAFRELTDPDERELPLRLPYPVNQVDSTVYLMREDGQYEVDLPEPREILSRFGSYSFLVEQQKKGLVVREQLQILPGEIVPEEYREFYDFITLIKRIQRSSPIIIQNKK